MTAVGYYLLLYYYIYYYIYHIIILYYYYYKTSLDLNKATGDGVLGWQWHQLDHVQTICTVPQTDNHTNTPSVAAHKLNHKLN